MLAYGIRTDFQTVAFPGSRRLLEIARAEKLDRVTVEIPEGNPLLDVCGGLGFALRPASGGIVCGSLEL